MVASMASGASMAQGATQVHEGVYDGEVHHWAGVDNKFHRVPSGFVWPSYSTFNMWNLWFNGDASSKIGPFRRIDTRDDLPAKICRTNRSRTVKVVSALVAIALSGELIDDEKDVDRSNYSAVFDYAYPLLLEQLYPDGKHRAADTNVNTVANRMYSVRR